MEVTSGWASASATIVTGGRTVDVRALNARADLVEAQAAGGVSAGTPVGLWLEDPADLAAGLFGLTAAGNPVFIIAPDSTPSTVGELCAIEGSTAVLCDEDRAARLTDAIVQPYAAGLVLVRTPHTASGAPPSAAGSVHFFTSGTDGRPKGVVRPRHSLAVEATAVGSHLGMGPGCVVLCAAPVSHAYGFADGLFAPLALGATSIVERPRLAASLARLLAEHQPDIVIAVPGQYAAWASLRQPYTGRMPRLWISSGAPLPAAVRSNFEAAWKAVISEQYGMTECGAVSVDLDGSATLGAPYPGVTLSIDGSDPEDVGEVGAVGEVVVASAHGATGYVGGPPIGAMDPFSSKGFRTADTGWLDDHGRLNLVGRRAHQVNVRGKKVDPAEIERALWTVEGMQDVAVIGIDRSTGDQWIAAFVVCAGETTDDVLHRATEGLEIFKRPQRITRLAALPRTVTGKLDRLALVAAVRS